MSLVIRVFACACGKQHTCSGVTVTSVCTCGRNIWDQMWKVGR